MRIAGVWVPVMGSNGAAPLSSRVHLMNIVEDEHTPTIVGAIFVGPGSGAMSHAATIAIVSKITLYDPWRATPAFPAIGEFWLRMPGACGFQKAEAPNPGAEMIIAGDIQDDYHGHHAENSKSRPAVG